MIDSSRIPEIMKDCLFRNEELVDGKIPFDALVIQGIKRTFGFHSERIKQHEAEITSMLNELPGTFAQGWTFLNMCFDKNNDQWTGLHATCEELMVLGMALGHVSYCAPRDLWEALPGGMPYIQINQEVG